MKTILEMYSSIPKRTRVGFIVSVVVLTTTLFGIWSYQHSRPVQAATFEFVLAEGLDRGPANDTNSVAVDENNAGAPALMSWQTSVKRTGDGAYHYTGGDIPGAETDLTVTSSGSPYDVGVAAATDMQAYLGAAFRFVSFPTGSSERDWILAFSPTDGVSGANNKPTLKIRPDGKLQLEHSNETNVGPVSSITLATNKWYYLLLHGLNGTAKQQQAFIYDGDTAELLETLNYTMDVTGTFFTKVLKWGGGTSQDTTGLEFYIDDLIFTRGDFNPGPVRVYPKKPSIVDTDEGYTPVGAADEVVAVNEVPSDDDTTYIRNNGAVTSNHSLIYNLAPLSLSSTDTVRAVISNAIERHTGLSPTPRIGVRVGGSDAINTITSAASYRARQVIQTTNPATGTSWAYGDVNSIKGMIVDQDSLAREFLITGAWWDIVYAQSPGSSPPPPGGCSPSTNPSDYHFQFVRQNSYPTIDWNQSYQFEVVVKNTGTATWCQGTVNLGTDRARDRIPGFVREDLENHNGSGWVSPNRVQLVESSVAPNAEGTFRFWMTPLSGKTPGTYREYFRVVADGLTWMEDYGIYWDVKVPTLADSYHAQFISQNGYPTLQRGQSYQFEVQLKNTGVKPWVRGAANLGTDRARDRVPGFVRDGGNPSGWITPNRVQLVESSVASDGAGTFRFWYTVPSDKAFGTYREYFRPVADGITWMDDWGIYWDVTVQP